MPHVIAFEPSESQRRMLNDKINELNKNGWPLTGKHEAEKFGTWKILFENLLAPSLFAQRETIVIESADTLGIFPDILKNSLEDENADCILILVFTDDLRHVKNIRDKIEVIAPEKQIPQYKRAEWLISLANENNFKIRREAANLLVESIDSQEELRSELFKLALFCDGQEIKINDVRDLSFDEGGRAQLRLLDGICENNYVEVIKALKYLREMPLAPVLAAVCNRLRPAMTSAIFSSSKFDRNLILKAAGLTAAKTYAMQKSERALKIFGREKIFDFMLKAVRLSYLEKTNNSEGWPGFELILLNLLK